MPSLIAHADVIRGLEIWILITAFLNFQILCIREAKPQTRLRICAGSSKSTLVADAIVYRSIYWDAEKTCGGDFNAFPVDNNLASVLATSGLQIGCYLIIFEFVLVVYNCSVYYDELPPHRLDLRHSILARPDDTSSRSLALRPLHYG